jgi:hypothetical protein
MNPCRDGQFQRVACPVHLPFKLANAITARLTNFAVLKFRCHEPAPKKALPGSPLHKANKKS